MRFHFFDSHHQNHRSQSAPRSRMTMTKEATTTATASDTPPSINTKNSSSVVTKMNVEERDPAITKTCVNSVTNRHHDDPPSEQQQQQQQQLQHKYQEKKKEEQQTSSPTQSTFAYPYSKPPMNHTVCQLHTQYPGSHPHHRQQQQQQIEQRRSPVHPWQDAEETMKQQQYQRSMLQNQSSSSSSSHSLHHTQIPIRSYTPTRLRHSIDHRQQPGQPQVINTVGLRRYPSPAPSTAVQWTRTVSMIPSKTTTHPSTSGYPIHGMTTATATTVTPSATTQTHYYDSRSMIDMNNDTIKSQHKPSSVSIIPIVNTSTSIFSSSSLHVSSSSSSSPSFHRNCSTFTIPEEQHEVDYDKQQQRVAVCTGNYTKNVKVYDESNKNTPTPTTWNSHRSQKTVVDESPKEFETSHPTSSPSHHDIATRGKKDLVNNTPSASSSIITRKDMFLSSLILKYKNKKGVSESNSDIKVDGTSLTSISSSTLLPKTCSSDSFNNGNSHNTLEEIHVNYDDNDYDKDKGRRDNIHTLPQQDMVQYPSSAHSKQQEKGGEQQEHQPIGNKITQSYSYPSTTKKQTNTMYTDELSITSSTSTALFKNGRLYTL